MADPFEIPDGAEDQYEDEDIQSADQVVDRDSIGSGASGYTTPLAKKNAIDAAGSYINALKSSQKTNAEIMQEAQRVLLQRANEGMDAGGWFKIAAALGKPTRTGSFGETLGNVTGRAVTGAGLSYVINLAKDYGSEVGTGGKVDWKKTFIQVTPGIQDYDLQALVGDVKENCNRIEIKRIFHDQPPASARIYDPFSMTGMSYSNVLQELGFGASWCH